MFPESLVEDYTELLDAGLDLHQVPDAVLWDSIRNSDRFKKVRLTGGENIDNETPATGVNSTVMVTDTNNGKRYFIKQEQAAPEAPLTEMIVNEYAHNMGLPVGSFRFANDGSFYEELLTMQEHVGDHIATPLLAPDDGPELDEVYRPFDTFNENVRHNVDNIASMLILDWVSANADRSMSNFFLTKSHEGEIHAVPIDHGFAFDAATGRNFESPQDFLNWATFDDRAGNQTAGWLHVLSDQEANGFATREQILDALELAVGRAQSVDGRSIDERSRERLPEGYSETVEPTAKIVYNGMGDALDTRADALASITREQFNESLNRIANGESTRRGSRLRETPVKYESPGITVRKDAVLLGMDEEMHGLRQPNGLLVRGRVMRRDEVPEETFRVGFFEGEDAVTAGPVNQDGIHAGFNPLHTDPKAAEAEYFDYVLYRDMSQLWADDDFDAAFSRLSEEAESYKFSYVSEDKARDLWDREEPVRLMELLWGPRSFFTNVNEPFIDPDLQRFFAARDLPEPSMITVTQRAVPQDALVTELGGVFRIYGDLDFSG